MTGAAKPKVTVIPATGDLRRTSGVTEKQAKRRVAGYARVSTDNEEQLNSYEAQVDFYTNYIKARADWKYCGVYADEGISATSTAKREGFKSMVADALAGKLDLIITKSVSRFARNTVDTLTTVRNLKEKGVEVYFEKENIYTLDSKGELLITIMSSLAQEESRSISENVTWGQRKRMQDGKVTMPYARFLGYEKGEDGLPKIIEAEAKVVRLIYTLFLQGKTQNAIARYLTAEGIPTPAKKTKWSVSTVLSILTNEKYRGDARLQKGFTVDFLTKKTKKNEGEVPQYYVEGSHPAIVEPEIYDLVQAEIKKRKPAGLRQSAASCFSSKIVCGSCKSYFGYKLWHSTSIYRRTVWRCNHKYKDGCKCHSPHLYEATIQKAFINTFNRLCLERERLKKDYAEIVYDDNEKCVFDNVNAGNER
jgi:DNA invertase Pin-like site-specific DNA recombinase